MFVRTIRPRGVLALVASAGLAFSLSACGGVDAALVDSYQSSFDAAQSAVAGIDALVARGEKLYGESEKKVADEKTREALKGALDAAKAKPAVPEDIQSGESTPMAQDFTDAQSGLTAVLASAAVIESDLSKAIAGVEESMLKKATDDLNAKIDAGSKLWKETDGKVADEKTRQAMADVLAAARKVRDAAGFDAAKGAEQVKKIDAATKGINDSVAAKTKADEEAAAAAGTEPYSDGGSTYTGAGNTGGDSSGGSGGGSDPSEPIRVGGGTSVGGTDAMEWDDTSDDPRDWTGVGGGTSIGGTDDGTWDDTSDDPRDWNWSTTNEYDTNNGTVNGESEWDSGPISIN